MPAMTSKQVALHMETLPKWEKRGRRILRTFVFKGFPNSIDFVKRIARQAQRNDHHPDIDIRFNKVTLTLTTHTEGGLTGKDFDLARQSEDLFARYFAT